MLEFNSGRTILYSVEIKPLNVAVSTGHPSAYNHYIRLGNRITDRLFDISRGIRRSAVLPIYQRIIGSYP